MHIPDIYVVKPVFWEGEIVCFAVTTAHYLDLGRDCRGARPATIRRYFRRDCASSGSSSITGGSRTKRSSPCCAPTSGCRRRPWPKHPGRLRWPAPGAVFRIRAAGREERDGFAPVGPGRLRGHLGFGGLPHRREGSRSKTAVATGVIGETSVRCLGGLIPPGKCR